MKDSLEDYKEERLYIDAQKRLWWGEGEWVDEPDYVTFTSSGLKCIVHRQAIADGPKHVFGGFLNGYVTLCEGHPWLNEGMRIDCDVHWGITFNEGNIIGFDCSHLGDFVPSTEMLYKADENMKKIRQEAINFVSLAEEKCGHSLSHIFQNTYRNLAFCIEQCISLAQQAKQTIN